MYRILIIVFCLLSVSIAQPGFSQEAVNVNDVEVCDKCDLPTNTILIVNSGNKTLGFFVKPKGGKKWNKFRLKSTDSVEIACRGCKSKINKFEFQMKTGKQKVEYALPIQKRYVLHWNAERKLWDLYTAKL
jgi:hypothetical protein